MFPPFPENSAKQILVRVLKLLDEKKLCLKQVTKPSEERKNSPVMIGALVCVDKNQNKVNLIANSGISKQLEFCDENDDENLVIVGPVVSAEKIEEALSKNDDEIHRITEILKSQKQNDFRVKPENDTKRKPNNDTKRKIDNDTKRKTKSKERDLYIEEIKSKRAELCAQSLEKVESLYNFACADGKTHSLKEMCIARNKGKFPPTGTGDCSAPKLLNYAFSHGLTPISLAEVVSTGRATTVPPCDARCKIILPEILGLEILYQDSSIVVVNKQSGLLSVPGRGEEKFDSVETRLRRLFPDCIKQPAVHRLDMETSGIMVLALTKEAHRKMNMAFESREVKKEYTALLDGVLAKKGIANEGEMTLYFRLDTENRPHQIWDAENGKKSITQWKILDVERYKSPDGIIRNVTRVLFTPLTGRTHQLRLASADSHGFGVPIIGDTLYGHCGKGERLMLHASRIEFTHPETGEKMIFESKPEF